MPAIRNQSHRAFRPTLSRLEDRLTPVNNTFSALSGGNWDNALNWSLNHVPFGTDDVIIPAAATGTITVNNTAHSFNSFASTAVSPATLSVASGGSFAVAASSTVGCNLALGTGTSFTAPNGVNLAITGGVTLTGGTLSVGGTITNSGTLTSPAAAFGAFNNTGGTIHVTAGTLSFGNGTNTGGIFQADAGASIDLPLSSWTGTYTGSGAGFIRFNSGLNIGATGATFNLPDFRWTGGDLNGTLTNAGTLNIPVASTPRLVGGLVNNGTVHQSATLATYSNGSITNNAGKTYDVASNITFTDNAYGSDTFTNNGLFIKSAGTGTASFVGGNWSFDNTGTVESQSGTLALSNNGTNAGGTYNALAGATLDLGDSTYSGTLAGGAGTGTVRINSGLVGTATLNFPGTLLQWAGGDLKGAFTNTGTLNISGGNNPRLYGTLANDGTVRQTADLGTYGNGGITNNAGKTYNVAGAYNFYDNAYGTDSFTNNGLFIKSAGSSSTSFVGANWSFSNTGTVESQSGTLALSNNGTSAGGTYNALAGATLDLGDSTYSGTLTGGTGTGTVRINSGLVGTATLNFPGTLLQWAGGDLKGAFTNTGTLNISGGNNPRLYGTLANDGTVRQTADLGTYGNGGITNNAGKTYNVAGAYNLYDNAYGTDSFTNNGLFIKSAGTGTASFSGNNWSFDNSTTGTVEADAGTLALSNNGSNTGGAYKALAGSFIDLGTASYNGTFTGTGTGTVRINAGLSVATATFNFPSTLLQWTGGDIANGTFTNTGNLNITGGNAPRLGNNLALVNSGTIRQTSNLATYGPSTLANNAGATYDLAGNFNLTDNAYGNATFTNSGLVVKSAGTGVATFSGGNWYFNNTANGTVEVDAGTLVLCGGTNSGGTYVATTASSLVDLGNANYTGTFTGSGAGTVRINTGLTVGAASFNFPGTLLKWRGGDITGTSLTNANILNIPGGNVASAPRLYNTLTLINNGTIHQSADLATYGAPNIANNAGKTYDLAGGYNIADNPYGAASFTNNGLLVKTASNVTAAVIIIFNNSATGTVQSDSGTLQLRGGTNTGGTYTATAVNSTIDLGNATYTGTYTGGGLGTVRINSGLTIPAGSTTFNFPFTLLQWTGGDITGDTFINTGILNISGGSAPRLTNGINLVNNGTIRQTADLVTYGAPMIFNNTGKTYDLAGNVSITNNPYGVARFTNYGTIVKSAGTGFSYVTTVFNQVDGTAEADTGILQFRSGSNTGGRYNALTNATIDLGNADYTGSYTGNGAGTVRINSGLNIPGANMATFTFPFGLLQWTGGDLTGSVFANAGTLNIAAGNSPRLIATINNTSVIAQTTDLNTYGNTSIINAFGGTYDLQGNVSVFGNPYGSASFTNAGTVKKSAGTGTSSFSASFTNTGTVDVQTGTLDTPGTLSLTGVLQGSGTLLAPVTNSSGSVRPGSSPGKLTINGGYTQSGSGDLRIELDGTTPGTTYDQLAVIGTVNLAGSLTASLGYAYAVNDTYTIIDNDGGEAINGVFIGLVEGASVTLINGGTAKISYIGGTGNDVTLTINSTVPRPGVTSVLVNAGADQRSRVTSLSVNFNGLVTLAANAFTLTRPAFGTTSPLAATLSSAPTAGQGRINVTTALNAYGVTVATLTFATNSGSTTSIGDGVEFGSLSDGSWVLTVNAPAVTIGATPMAANYTTDNTAGAKYTQTGRIYRLFGDFEGDADVDSINAAQIRQSFLSLASNPNGPPPYIAAFDFDGDGDIDTLDLARFRQRFTLTV